MNPVISSVAFFEAVQCFEYFGPIVACQVILDLVDVHFCYGKPLRGREVVTVGYM